MRYLPRHVAFVALAWASMSGIGCSGYNALRIPAPSPRREIVGESIRVTKKDGSRIELRSAYVEGDSIKGPTMRAGEMVAVPISNIALLESRGLNTGKTLGLLGGIGALIGVSIILAFLLNPSWT